jgi:hypothetical protein
MNLRRLAIGPVILFLSLGVFGVEPAAAQKVGRSPFEPGEELIYKAEVSKSLLKKVDVATFRFLAERGRTTPGANTSTGTDSASYALKFTGDVSSEGFFVKLFNLKFHQHVESTVDPESLSVQKTVKFDEQGKRVRTSEATFDRRNGKLVWTERDPNNPTRPPRIVNTDFNGTVQDIVSAIYYVRTQKLDVGDSFEVPISDSGQVYRIPVRVVEKKRMKTALGRVTAVRVEPELFGESGMVKAKGQMFVWLTEDPRHIPVSAQLKGEFGTFDIILKRVGHQSNQQASLKNR